MGVVSTVSVASLAVVFSPKETLAIDANVGGKIQFGDEGIMSPKEHGTSANPVQGDLLYGTDNKLADKISNFNRHFAENGGYFQSTSFENTVLQAKDPITFYDSVTGKALFVAPINRSAKEFIAESKVHGWPSFRDEEVFGIMLEFSNVQERQYQLMELIWDIIYLTVVGIGTVLILSVSQENLLHKVKYK